MIETRSKPATLFLLTGVLLASGCKKQSAPPPNAAGSTGAPAAPVGVRNSDGSITNPDGSVTYPAGSSVARGVDGSTPASAPASPVTSAAPAPQAAAPAPSAPAPAPSAPAPAPAPAPLVVPVHTAVIVRLTTGLAASRNEVGDRWTGVLESPIRVRGTEVFRSGTPVSGEVVSSKGKGRFKGAGDLGISVTAIGRDHVDTSVYEKEAKGRGKRTAGFIGGGAGLGALIGGLAGGGKGALIGGLAGAGGGTAAGAYTGSRDVTIASESVITFRLTEPLRR